MVEASSGSSRPAWRTTLGRLGLMHCRTRVPGLLLLGIVAMSSLQRAILLIVHQDRLKLEQVDGGEMIRAMLVGLRFDLVVAGMIVVPLLPIMFLAMPRVIVWRWFKRGVAGYVGAALGLTAFALVADGYFFGEFGDRLDHKVFNYPAQSGNAYILQVIWDQYPVLPVLAGALAVGAAGAWLTLRIGFADRYNVGPRWQAILWPTAFAAFTGLGIRGSLSSHAINTGPAYFTTSNSLTQLTLNGLFTLRQAVVAEWSKEVRLASMYDLLDDQQVDQRMRELVFTERDEPIADPDNPLRRVTRSARPRRDLNVVVVVMESLHWAYVGHLGGQAGLTPNLDAIAEAGVYAEHAYAVGDRTQRGFAGIVSGFPDLPRSSVTTREKVAGQFLTLPGLLKQRDYQTLFIYGGPAHRDHRQTFLASNGVDRFVVENDLPVRTFRTKLGYNDRDLFQSTVRILSDLPQDRPFFALLLTLTFHRPYEFPGSDQLPASATLLDRQLAAVRFTDAAIGRFLEEAKQQDWFDRTIFVFVADHSGGLWQHPNGPPMYRIPMVFYGPKIDGLQPRRIQSVRSQMDVAPTVMELLGGSYEHCFFGTNIFAETPRYACAMTAGGDLIFYTRPDAATIVPPNRTAAKALQFDPHTGAAIDAPTPDTHDVESAIAVVQMAHRLFHHHRFNVVPPGERGE